MTPELKPPAHAEGKQFVEWYIALQQADAESSTKSDHSSSEEAAG